MKNFLRIFLFFVFSFFIFIIYLSTIGIETKRLNKQISNKIKNIDENLIINLKEIKIILNPLKFELNIKPSVQIKSRGKVLEIEYIKTQIPLSSLFKEKFLIKNLEISSKLLEIEDLISFVSPIIINFTFLIRQSKRFSIADIKLNDVEGNIKDDFQINGFIKDTKIQILKKYELKKLDFNFIYNKVY